jgi:ABC-type multidrug transport system fused ATPase/permease subunit
MLAQIILLAVPYVAARAINTLQLHGAAGLGEAGLWLSGVLLLAIASWMVHGPGRLLERNVALRVRHRLSTSLLERLFTLPLSWHESNHSGATAHRVQQSSHALSSFAESQFIYLNSAVRLVGPIVALGCIEPMVGLVCVAGFAIITVSVMGFDRTMIRLAKVENDAERKYAATLVDALGNTTTVFALRQARAVIALLERRLLEIFVPLKRSIIVNEAKWFTVDLATRALSAILVALFAWRVTHHVAAGAAVHTGLLLGSVYMVWEYANQASGVVVSVAEHFQSFARQHADYTSADVIRDAAPTQIDGSAAALIPNWKRLDIQNLTFSHCATRTDRPSLDRMSLSLERGKRYAVIGDSGSGKSTLLRVMAGLYICDSIGIRHDSSPIVTSPAETARLLRSCATLIPQDAEVFAGSIADNLALCSRVDGPPSREDFSNAMHVARADFMDTSPEGLEVEVAERAANWSGGQRSRIALARGVLAAKGSALVLLDEPTAHLDPTTEALVYSGLFAEFKDACIVSSVHRLHLLERFDEVLIVQSGRLIAQGTPAALALNCPQFRQIAGHLRREETPTEVAA